MKLTLSVEFDNVDEYIAVGEAFIAAGFKSGETSEAKKTRKKAGEKTEEKPNGPASAVVLPMTNGQPESNPLGDLAGSGLNDLDDMLGLGKTTKAAPKFTVEELRAKAGEIASVGGKEVTNKVVALLKSYGIKSITDLPEDKFEDFNSKLDLLKK